MIPEELDKLKALHDEGALSDTEYSAAKDRLLNKSNALASSDHPNTNDLFGMTPSTYATVMHLSQYATYLIPLAGVIIPIGMWLYGRDKNEFVNEHGQNLMNFLVSYFIYATIAGILCFVAVGFVLLPILVLVTLILPIFGAIAASKSQNYRYPLTIKFF